MKHLWFRAKRYGYGWYPANWQGWVVLLVYVLFVAIGAAGLSYFRTEDAATAYTVIMLVATAVLIYICYRTGEPLAWHWGDTEKKP